MFTGIIKKTGTVKKIISNEKEIKIGIKSRLKLSNKDLGSSINCSGVCLTLEKIYKGLYYFHLSSETLRVSNFKNIKPDLIVKGGDYKFSSVVGRNFSNIVIFPRIKNFSSSKIIKKII